MTEQANSSHDWRDLRYQSFYLIADKIVLELQNMPQKNNLHRQLTNLGMQLFDLAVPILSLFNLVRENACHAFDRLTFPCAHLRWVELPLGRNLLNRLVTAQRLKRHCSFKLV